MIRQLHRRTSGSEVHPTKVTRVINVLKRTRLNLLRVDLFTECSILRLCLSFRKLLIVRR